MYLLSYHCFDFYNFSPLLFASMPRGSRKGQDPSTGYRVEQEEAMRREWKGEPPAGEEATVEAFKRGIGAGGANAGPADPARGAAVQILNTGAKGVASHQVSTSWAAYLMMW